MKLVIFGCGHIAHRIAKGAKLCKEVDFIGFGSRDINKAKEYALMYECKEYGTYDDFFNSDVDIVYIATINKTHYDLIKTCLQHHKNVICEKPMCNSKKELEELFAIAKENDVLLMEAMKAVFQPINQKVKQMVKDKVIGEIQSIETSFANAGETPSSEHWLMDPVYGGIIKDVGCYCVAEMNYVLDKVPSLISKETNRTDLAETDAHVTLMYNDIHAKFFASCINEGPNDLLITGTKGYIKVHNFWKASEGIYEVDGIQHEIKEEMLSDFYYEIKHMVDCVTKGLKESPIMSKQASENILLITE